VLALVSVMGKVYVGFQVMVLCSLVPSCLLITSSTSEDVVDWLALLLAHWFFGYCYNIWVIQLIALMETYSSLETLSSGEFTHEIWLLW